MQRLSSTVAKHLLVGTFCALALACSSLNASAQYTFSVTSAPASLSVSGGTFGSGGWKSWASTAGTTLTLFGGPGNLMSTIADATTSVSGSAPFFFCGAATNIGGSAFASASTSIAVNLKVTGPIHSNIAYYDVKVVLQMKSRSRAEAMGYPGAPGGTQASGLSFRAFASQQGSQWMPWAPNPVDTGVVGGGSLFEPVTIKASNGIGFLAAAGLSGQASATGNSAPFAAGTTAYKVWIAQIIGPDGITNFSEPDPTDTLINGFVAGNL